MMVFIEKNCAIMFPLAVNQADINKVKHYNTVINMHFLAIVQTILKYKCCFFQATL